MPFRSQMMWECIFVYSLYELLNFPELSGIITTSVLSSIVSCFLANSFLTDLTTMFLRNIIHTL